MSAAATDWFSFMIKVNLRRNLPLQRSAYKAPLIWVGIVMFVLATSLLATL